MKKKLLPIFFFLLFLILLGFLTGCNTEGPSLPDTSSSDPSIGPVGSTATTFAVTATADEHGSINPSGEITVPIGESITLKISADEYYNIDEVYVNGVSEGAIDTLVLTVTGGSANFAVHATFTGKQEVRIDGKPYVYETINSALNAAKSSETIIVYPGIYNEYLVLSGKNITLRGCDPSDPSIVADTIIDGGGSHSVITCSGGDVSTITGLTIRNGGGYIDNGGGIYIYDSTPTIGGVDAGDTENFNHIYDNIPDEIYPDNYPYNYFINLWY